MNQVHVVISGRRESFSSFDAAVKSIRSRFIFRRCLHLLRQETIQFFRDLFLVE